MNDRIIFKSYNIIYWMWGVVCNRTKEEKIEKKVEIIMQNITIKCK
jgi:hypothetical protein